MITVGVRELREDLSKLLQRVREEGEVIEITVRGEAVARVIPTQEKSLSHEEVTKQFTELDDLIARIKAQTKGEVDAVESVRQIRRDL